MTIAVNATLPPDLNDVLMFTRVVKAGSFTAAARALGTPTSTVSRRVSRLEDHLGVRLLQRTTRKLSLTDAGRLYYDHSSRMLSSLEDAERAVTELQGTPRGRLRATAPVELHGFSTLVTGFLAEYPDVELELDLTNRNVDLVAEGYDVAIRAGTLSDSSLVAHKLFEATRSLVASPDYLERRGEPTSIGKLAEHDCVIFASPTPRTQWTLRGPRNTVKVSVRGRITVNNLDYARRAAIDGLGIALLPTMLCIPDLCAGTLREVLPGSCPSKASVSAVYPTRRHLSPAVRAFVDYLKSHFAELVLELPAACKTARA